MSTRLYKDGKLTAEAKEKLQKRLQKENQKPKVSKSKGASKKATPSTTKPSTAKPAAPKQKLTAELVSVPTASPQRKMPTKASDLTMADICDTPPRNKMVAERNEAMNENNDVNWISLIGYNQIEAENEEKLYSKLNQQSNDRFKSDLDAQIGIKQQQKSSSDAELVAYRQALNDQFKSYRAEDAKKVGTQHAETLKLKEIREEQVAEADLKRKYAELKEKKHELRAVQKLKKALAVEQREKVEKKERVMATLKDMLIDNERQKALKEEQRLKEEEEAIRLQKEYAKMLKEQEEKRAQHLKVIQAKQQQKFMALISATADVREKAEEDAKKAEVELKRRQKVADQKELDKRERQRVDQKEREVAIDRQIQEKMNKIRTDILEDKEYGKKMTKLHAEYLQEIEDKKTEKLRKQQEQSTYLQQQINDLEIRKKEQKTEMSHTEKMMNKQLLDQVRDIKSSPKKEQRERLMKAKEETIKIDPRAPFQFRYLYRKSPF